MKTAGHLDEVFDPCGMVFRDFELRYPRCVSQNHKIKQQKLESQNYSCVLTFNRLLFNP